MTSTTGVLISSSALRRLALLGATFSATAPVPVSTTASVNLADPSSAVQAVPVAKRVRYNDSNGRSTRSSGMVALQLSNSPTSRRPKERSPSSKRQLHQQQHQRKQQSHQHLLHRATATTASTSTVRLSIAHPRVPNMESRRSISFLSLFKSTPTPQPTDRLVRTQDSINASTPALLQGSLNAVGTRGLSTAEATSYTRDQDTNLREQSRHEQPQRMWEPPITRPDVQMDQINTLLRHPALFTEVQKPRLPIVLCHGESCEIS